MNGHHWNYLDERKWHPDSGWPWIKKKRLRREISYGWFQELIIWLNSVQARNTRYSSEVSWQDNSVIRHAISRNEERENEEVSVWKIELSCAYRWILWRYLAFELRRGARAKSTPLGASYRQEKTEEWSGQEGFTEEGKGDTTDTGYLVRPILSISKW